VTLTSLVNSPQDTGLAKTGKRYESSGTKRLPLDEER